MTRRGIWRERVMSRRRRRVIVRRVIAASGRSARSRQLREKRTPNIRYLDLKPVEANTDGAPRPTAGAPASAPRTNAWFWPTAKILFLLVAASAVPAPLYRVYQDKWGFSDTTLTAVFAVYVFALLLTLLVAGSLSDHLGRRPIIATGLILEIATCLIFASAGGVPDLFAARAIQALPSD